MEKLCVFCGQKPERKSNEHVIPQWLIELTGNPKRTAEFGYKNNKSPSSGKRTYSFVAFKFPSCQSCNQKHSRLEADAKPIVHKILSADNLSAAELSILLDWFDKIRVGLWLGFQYLDQNPAGITPRFHIEKRIGLSDRMLAIFKGDGKKQGLNFVGCDMPSFVYTPSCFSLRIDNYCFLNISCYDLLSRRIGFPHASESFIREDGSIEARPVRGRDRIMVPVLKKRFSIRGTELYQPMFPYQITKSQKLYDTKYVRDNSLSWNEGIGKVFIQDNTGFQEYPSNPSKKWLPGTTYPFDPLLFEMQLLTIEWQTYVDNRAPSLEKLSKEKEQQFREIFRLKRLHNTRMAQTLRRKAQEIGMPSLVRVKSVH